jgi:type IV pilus assembly protein PilA
MKKDKGFTLIELLVVIAIIGILAAIAIPQFAEYRQRGFDSRAKSDLRNVATAEEAYFADTEKYFSCSLTSGAGTCTSLPGVEQMSEGVDLAMTNNSNASFTGTATHGRGSGVTYNWNSANGGLQ